MQSVGQRIARVLPTVTTAGQSRDRTARLEVDIDERRFKLLRCARWPWQLTAFTLGRLPVFIATKTVTSDVRTMSNGLP
jgi:hypothetical protein